MWCAVSLVFVSLGRVRNWSSPEGRVHYRQVTNCQHRENNNVCLLTSIVVNHNVLTLRCGKKAEKILKPTVNELINPSLYCHASLIAPQSAKTEKHNLNTSHYYHYYYFKLRNIENLKKNMLRNVTTSHCIARSTAFTFVLWTQRPA